MLLDDGGVEEEGVCCVMGLSSQDIPSPINEALVFLYRRTFWK